MLGIQEFNEVLW